MELLEGHAMNDHIHMCISVPPKYSIAMTIGYLKGRARYGYTERCLELTKDFRIGISGRADIA